MEEYVMTRAGVRSWPDDPEARVALEAHMDALAAESSRVLPALAGDFLDFTGADLSRIELSAAGLFGARLTDVPMTGANLTRATLNGAQLDGADLTSVLLFRADAHECRAKGTSFRRAGLVHADLGRADLRDADLRETDLTAAYLGDADLRGADLRGCSFGPAERPTALSRARLADCRLEGASGHVVGPIDVGVDGPELRDGPELSAWFRSGDAPDVHVITLMK